MIPHNFMLPPRDTEALIRDTWSQYHELRAAGPYLMVRTWEIPDRIGRIYLPDESRRFYKGLPHLRLVRATVVSVPRAFRQTYGEGEFVAFPQTFFTRLATMTDGTFLGLVRAQFVHGKVMLDRDAELEIQAVREGRACAA